MVKILGSEAEGPRFKSQEWQSFFQPFFCLGCLENDVESSLKSGCTTFEVTFKATEAKQD